MMESAKEEWTEERCASVRTKGKGPLTTFPPKHHSQGDSCGISFLPHSFLPVVAFFTLRVKKKEWEEKMSNEFVCEGGHLHRETTGLKGR